MSLDDLVGRSYGPVSFTAGRSADAFVAATGDDPDRWRDHAPPAFAAAVLFAVAPSFLTDPDVAPTTRSLVHTEQEFAWDRALEISETLDVRGEVTGVRSRGALHVATFSVVAGGASPWLTSTSSFLLSSAAAGSAAEEPEPGPDERGPFEPAGRHPLPPVGSDLPELRRSASRADLVRYAGATGDWNPIHRDHEAARSAGLPGVVVHGLLMTSWLAQAAARHVPGPDPLRSMRARFRAPLRPARGAVISGRVAASGDDGVDLALDLSAGGERLVTSTVRVTP
jgi:acyl dehydratase